MTTFGRTSSSLSSSSSRSSSARGPPELLISVVVGAVVVVVVANVVIVTGVSSVSGGIRASRALRSSGSSNVDVEEVRVVEGTLVEGFEKCLPMSSTFRRMVTSLAENAVLLPNSRVIITALRSVRRVG